MSRHEVVALDADLVVRVVEVERAFSPEIEARVAATWERLRREAPGRLHDGTLATLESADPKLVCVGRVSYRYFAAQLADPGLADALDLWCVGVSGATRAGDRLLFGRRALVSQHAGCWELMPSGHLPVEVESGASLDPAAQLRRELQEEVGISPDRVTSTAPIALIPDAAIRTTDIFLSLGLDLTPPEVDDALACAPREEYDRMRAVPIDGLAAFRAEHSDRLLRSSQIALARLGHDSANAEGI